MICGVIMGKGSKPRPLAISQQQFEENWKKIFGDKHENNRVRTGNGGMATSADGSTKREQLPQDSNDNG